VWTYAVRHGYVIVSKDAEFHQQSFLLGPPPKVFWIQRGNCSTGEIETLLRQRHLDLQTFDTDPEGVVPHALLNGTFVEASQRPNITAVLGRARFPPGEAT
jgi:hypothetical protein